MDPRSYRVRSMRCRGAEGRAVRDSMAERVRVDTQAAAE